jgi:hypothetical protein
VPEITWSFKALKIYHDMLRINIFHYRKLKEMVLGKSSADMWPWLLLLGPAMAMLKDMYLLVMMRSTGVCIWIIEYL